MNVTKVFALVCAMFFSIIVAEAKGKDIKEITFKVEQLTSEKAEKELIKDLKVIKGIESVDASVKAHTVKLVYDGNETSATKIANHLEKNKYKISPVLPDPKKEEPKKEEPKKEEPKKEEKKR